jgi:hypothetical protein
MVGEDDRSSYRILICMVETWRLGNGEDPMAEPKSPNIFTEVESIEIEDKYTVLITGATVKFPRGTILRRTVTPENGYIYDRNVNATIGADGIVSEAKNDSVMCKNESGEWVEKKGARLAEVTDFAVGDRIRIRLGYTTEPKVLDMTKYNSTGQTIYTSPSLREEYKNHLTTMFEGYISKVSLDTPITLECENLASVLKEKICPNRQGKISDTLNFFFGETDDGPNLLKGTHFKLHPDIVGSEDVGGMTIGVGQLDMHDDMTVADVLEQIATRKVYSFVKFNGSQPCISFARSYFTKSKADSVVNIQRSDPKVVNFDWNVADNGLTLMATDKNLVAVEAQCLEQNEGKDVFYKIYIIRNPEYDPSDPDSKPYREVNERKLTKKGAKLHKKVVSSGAKVKISNYNIIPYMSAKINCPHDQLVDEAIEYLEGYTPNGIDGSLTLFGDFNLVSGDKVKLVDNIHSGKNGTYLVGSVNTKFGVSGFRQVIKLPYCISRE